MKKTSMVSEEARSTRDHADWVRAHPRIDDSPFPEYPEEPKRRGASRGALPNGNPWHTELVTEKPGPRRVPSDSGRRERAGGDARTVEAPPKTSAGVAAVHTSDNPTDRRIGDDVSRRLASAKSLEGKVIFVEVRDGEVALRGNVTARTAKSEAERLASSVRSVKRIRNHIRVG